MNFWDILIPLLAAFIAVGLYILLKRRQRSGKFSGCAGCPYGGTCGGPAECVKEEDGKE